MIEGSLLGEKILHRYAGVLLAGLSIGTNDRLFISTEPVHWELANIVAAQAYKLGARYVEVSAIHPDLARARTDFAPEDSLSYVPDHIRAQIDAIANERWAYMRIDGEQNPWSMEGIDQNRNGVISLALAEARSHFFWNLQRDNFPWLIAAAPTPAWAHQVVHGHADRESYELRNTENGDMEEFWRILTPILKLDTADPPGSWHEHARRLDGRARALTGMGLRSLHFFGAGTDLHLGIPPGARWIGGSATTEDGRRFLPNIPTEEVFTAPDSRVTTGTVRVTRPVVVLGTRVTGIELRFDAGRVTSFHADHGQEALEQFLSMDKNAVSLGEVALVDTGSAISRSGRLFYSILFDENAASHIALGSAYPTCLQNGESLSDAQLNDAGLNTAKVHLDFMIGSEQIDVSASTADGTEVQLMKQGSFVHRDLI